MPNSQRTGNLFLLGSDIGFPIWIGCGIHDQHKPSESIYNRPFHKFHYHIYSGFDKSERSDLLDLWFNEQFLVCFPSYAIWETLKLSRWVILISLNERHNCNKFHGRRHTVMNSLTNGTTGVPQKTSSCETAHSKSSYSESSFESFFSGSCAQVFL